MALFNVVLRGSHASICSTRGRSASGFLPVSSGFSSRAAAMLMPCVSPTIDRNDDASPSR